MGSQVRVRFRVELGDSEPAFQSHSLKLALTFPTVCSASVSGRKHYLVLKSSKKGLGFEPLKGNSQNPVPQLQEYREDPVANEGLRGSIVGVLTTSGLDSDCPFREATPESEAVVLTEDDVSTVSAKEFDAYVSRLYEYLSVVENRLFSEGLHTLGEPPSVDQVGGCDFGFSCSHAERIYKSNHV